MKSMPLPLALALSSAVGLLVVSLLIRHCPLVEFFHICIFH